MLNSDKLYNEFLADLKTKISTARYTAARAVNTELIILYWDIGNSILEKQASEGWGTAVDLKLSFQDMKGFSTGAIRQLCRSLLHNCLGKLPVFGGLPVKMQNRTFFKI